MLVIVKSNDSCYAIRGWLHFKVADFVGLVNFEWHSQTKLAMLAFLYCREIVKNSIALVYEAIKTHFMCDAF